MGFGCHTRVQNRHTQFISVLQPRILSQKDTQLMNTEIHKLLQKEVISVTDPPQSQGFLVPKKDGSQRPVINLYQLNQFVTWEYFKMESIHLVKHLIQAGYWMLKIDLKDAYFQSQSAGIIRNGYASTGKTTNISFVAVHLVCPRPHIRICEDHTPNSGMTETTGSETDYICTYMTSFF